MGLCSKLKLSINPIRLTLWKTLDECLLALFLTWRLKDLQEGGIGREKRVEEVSQMGVELELINVDGAHQKQKLQRISQY